MNEREERLRTVGLEVRGRVSGKLGDVWWAFMLRGVLAGMLGLFALFWPTASFTILERVVGLYCLADALSGLMGARGANGGANLPQIVVGLMVGGILLFWPGTSVRTLLMVFGAWALFTGVSQIVAARRANVDDTGRGLMTGIGTTVAVIGLVLLIWPGSGVVAISWFIAFAALLFAALLIFLALRLKRLQQRIDNLAPLRPTE
jgi:uncharacterized membrane protein HdeD (DUF308 family)